MTTEYAALRASPTFAEEAFVVEVQSFLQTVMDEKGINKSTLAKSMGVSKARVSQMFSSEVKNFTIRLLAKALYAMGEKAELTCGAYREVEARRLRERVIDAASRGENVAICWEVTPFQTKSRVQAPLFDYSAQEPCVRDARVASAMRKFEKQVAA